MDLKMHGMQPAESEAVEPVRTGMSVPAVGSRSPSSRIGRPAPSCFCAYHVSIAGRRKNRAPRSTDSVHARGWRLRCADDRPQSAPPDCQAALTLTAKPIKTPIRLRRTCPAMFQSACAVWPARNSVNVPRLNEENVVNPARTPTIRNVRASYDSATRPDDSAPAIHPINTEPDTFDQKNAERKHAGNRALVNEVIEAVRAMLPSAPPMPTMNQIIAWSPLTGKAGSSNQTEFQWDLDIGEFRCTGGRSWRQSNRRCPHPDGEHAHAQEW